MESQHVSARGEISFQKRGKECYVLVGGWVLCVLCVLKLVQVVLYHTVP